MIYQSQLEQFLSGVDDELERRDWGHWPLIEHGPSLISFLRQHGVSVINDTDVVDLDKATPVT